MDTPDSRLETLVERRLDALADVRPLAPAEREALRPLATASDFALDTLVRQPGLVDARHAPPPPPSLDPADPEGANAMLRRWLRHLTPTGRAHLVIGRNLGADSVARRLRADGWHVERHGSRAGYRILTVHGAEVTA